MNTEKIDALLQQEGITREQLVSHWLNHGLIDINLMQSKPELPFVPVAKISDIKSGMFYHANGHISEEYVGDDCIAMIIAVNNAAKTASALVLESATLPFSSDGLAVDTRGLSGLTATKRICQTAAENAKHAEAAQYCQNFTCQGVAKGTAFLPSSDEVQAMIAYMFNIRAASVECGIFMHYVLTSCCDVAANMVEIYQIGSSKVGVESLDFPMQVHPIIKINLANLAK